MCQNKLESYFNFITQNWSLWASSAQNSILSRSVLEKTWVKVLLVECVMSREYFDDVFPTYQKKLLAWFVVFFNAAISTAWWSGITDLKNFNSIRFFLKTKFTNQAIIPVQKSFQGVFTSVQTECKINSKFTNLTWSVNIDAEFDLGCSKLNALHDLAFYTDFVLSCFFGSFIQGFKPGLGM